MARKALIEKEKRRKKLVDLKWAKRQELKKKIINPDLTDEERLAASIALNKMPKNSCPTRVRNRCQLTGRPRAFMRKFTLSRHCFRELASHGMIPGITKSSW